MILGVLGLDGAFQVQLPHAYHGQVAGNEFFQKRLNVIERRVAQRIQFGRGGGVLGDFQLLPVFVQQADIDGEFRVGAVILALLNAGNDIRQGGKR